MMVDQQQLWAGEYDGLIIYDSEIYVNLTRKVILYNKVTDGFQFTYAIPYFSEEDNSLHANVTSEESVIFSSQDAKDFVNGCTS